MYPRLTGIFQMREIVLSKQKAQERFKPTMAPMPKAGCRSLTEIDRVWRIYETQQAGACEPGAF